MGNGIWFDGWDFGCGFSFLFGSLWLQWDALSSFKSRGKRLKEGRNRERVNGGKGRFREGGLCSAIHGGSEVRSEEREGIYGAPYESSCMVDHPHVIDAANIFMV